MTAARRVAQGGAGPCPCDGCARRPTCRVPCELLERLLERPVTFRHNLSLIEGRHAARPVEDEPELRVSDPRASRVRGEVATLPPEERAVLQSTLDGETVQSLARATRRPTATVVRLHDRAVQLLRFRFVEGHDAPSPSPVTTTIHTAQHEEVMRHSVHSVPAASAPSPASAGGNRRSPPVTAGTSSAEPPRCAHPHCRRMVNRTDETTPRLAPYCAIHRREVGLTEAPAQLAVRPSVREAVVADEEGAAALFRAVEGCEAVVELITPAIAKALLLRNQNNRTVTPNMVDVFRRDMLAGEWRVNNQGIGLGRDGRLYDGQHRLMAVVAAGVPVRMLVVRCLEEGARATVDMGRARRVGDVLRMFDGEASGARVVTWVRAMEHVHGRRNAILSTHAARTEVRRYRRSIDWMLANGPRNRPYNRAGVVAALLYAHHVLGEVIEPFLLGYARGAGLEPGSPGLALRTFVGERMTRKDDRERGTPLKVLRCVLGYIRGETMERVMPSDEGYEYLVQLEAERAAALEASASGT